MPDPLAAERARVDGTAASIARDLAHPIVAPAGGNRWTHMAAVFGRLVAWGLEERAAALAAMRAEAARRLPDRDAIGRDVAMAWALDDAIAGWERARDRARFGVRRALAPLLAERRPSPALLAAARAVNDAAGGPLRDAEVVALVRREVFFAARRLEPRRVRRA